MRGFASTAVLAGTFLFAGAASASADYPATIKSHLSLTSAPECALCHTDGTTGLGTVHTLFGTTAHDTYKLTSGDAALLGTVLDKMKTDNVDSDGDGAGDIDELKAGTDPNKAGGGVVAPKPDLTYGCTATVAPGRPAPSSGAAFGLTLVAAIAVARRRRGLVGASRRSLVAAGLAASAVVLVGCYDVSYVSSDVCASGLAWTGGDKGSPNMHPGQACIACHASDEGPTFTIAGTIFAATAPDDCLGAKDSSIVITGADGKILTINANQAGNFYSELAVKMPYQAKVISGGKTKIMGGAQTTGDCNSCHTEEGANAAPGRITLP
jgi:MYXO-CTERM domain-containing protein